jgi:NAD(P)-dependent dehydrogenase (short-subunit alcohol dehydrogenase family)
MAATAELSDLGGRHVVVTGGRGGLGGAVVEAFIAAGAICHVPERSATGASARERVIPIVGIDLTREEQVRALYAQLPALWASVHLAGGYAGAPITDTTLADLRAQLDLNLVTAFLCSREAVRNMTASSASGGGRIVNVTSRAALVPSGGAIAYAAAKAGVVALTRSLAEEVRAQGILVNAIAPSIIDTPANRAAMPSADHRRWPKPAELAATIIWLASPANTATSGAVLPVYGDA